MTGHTWILTVVVILSMVCFAQAVVVDGNIGDSEYDITMVDTGDESSEDFYNTGLDIKSAYFDKDSSWYYMGLSTVVQPIDKNGDSTSFYEETLMSVCFRDATTMEKVYMFEVGMNVSGVAYVDKFEWNAGWQEVSSFNEGTDYNISVGNCLELQIAVAQMGSMPDSAFAQIILDGTGGWSDDTLVGIIAPEPMTLGLLGIGGGIFAMRRRRRK